MIGIPWRDIGVIAGYTKYFYFTYDKIIQEVPHFLDTFPDGTVFHFRAHQGNININKSTTDISPTLVFNAPARRIEMKLLSSETSSITNDTNIPYEMDCTTPNGDKFFLNRGQLYIQVA